MQLNLRSTAVQFSSDSADEEQSLGTFILISHTQTFAFEECCVLGINFHYRQQQHLIRGATLITRLCLPHGVFSGAAPQSKLE